MTVPDPHRRKKKPGKLTNIFKKLMTLVVKEQPKAKHAQKTLELREDFYAVTFVSMRHEVASHFKITKTMQGRNFYAILWIWLIEMTIIVIIFKSAVFDKMPFRIETPNVDVYITRFLATLLMHMNLIEDVKQGLNMILYLNTHPEEFSSTLIPFLCGFL